MRSRELSRRLRAVQDEAQLRGNVLAQLMGISESRVSKTLGGLVMPTQAEVAGLLAHCGVTDSRRDQILDLCDLRHDQSVLRLVGREQWAAYAALTNGASRLAEYQPTCIPALAQTPSYTEVYLASLRDWPDERAAIAQAVRRIADSERLSSVEIIISEWCLRTPVGNAAMMSEQLHHLLSLSIDGSMSVRVVARNYQPKQVLPGGFALMDFAEQPAVLYRDQLTSGLFLDDPREVATHQGIVERLKLLAFDTSESRRLIRSIAAEYSRAADDEAMANGAGRDHCMS